MDKPDLHVLAARTESIYDALGDLVTALDEAENAAFGEYEADDDDQPIEGTASGDPPRYFEKARGEITNARNSVAQCQEMIATVQGFRDFSESGSVPA